MAKAVQATHALALPALLKGALTKSGNRVGAYGSVRLYHIAQLNSSNVHHVSGNESTLGCFRGSTLFLNSKKFVVACDRLSISTSSYRRSLPAICSMSALTETVKEGMVDTLKSVDPEIRGDSIRKRFLDFYAARGHKLLPSSSLVPDDPTVLLTIAGMLQFKPIFLGQVPRSYPCATTTQKVVRTNDIENVGRTARHHTFFEMLGNFSFGDYFKQQAIAWAWELATKEFKLPVERVWVSVFEDDDEALAIWRDEVGVPVERIKRMGAEDNFWSSGATGPCGPCSEMYFDFHPERGTDNADLNDDSRFIEFYNLVFMQYNRTDDGQLEPLKNKNIDTGLGLERMAQILQQVPNNYETDLIYPIIARAAELANVNYQTADDHVKTYLKVIGDHTRAVVYLISDGVYPSNIGRGYIVRRLIRRVVRMGRLLGIRGDGRGNQEGAFLPTIAEVAVGMSGDVDPNVQQQKTKIYNELKREELRFVQTLEKGEKLLEELLTEALEKPVNDKPCLNGKDVFRLYDTFGFPVEITEEVASERGVAVDLAGFEAEMDVQRKQSQAAHNVIKLAVGGAAQEMIARVPETEFLGYNELSSSSSVLAILANGESLGEAREGEEVEIVLDRTPFYAESGGQVGDHGYLRVFGSDSEAVVKVKDVVKEAGRFRHIGVVQDGFVRVGLDVDAEVDSTLRQRAQAHHTATHLLQAALKDVLGSDVSQAGSLVAFDRLRFDFNLPRAMTEAEVLKVESLVNEWIGMGVSVTSEEMAIGVAKEKGAIAMFGEKYGEQVRVVSVPGISMELCGGTHVGNIAEIRGLKIVSEQGIASGVRRIEAVAGNSFIEYINARDAVVKQLSSFLKVKADDLAGRVTGLQEEVRAARNEASALRVELAVAKAEALIPTAVSIGDSNTRVLVASLDKIDAESLKAAAEHLLSQLGDPAAVVVGSSPGDGKVSLVATFSPSVVKQGIQAGKFVGTIAKICGGGGGGRPNFAQAGGRQPEKLQEALEKAKEDLKAQLSKSS
ncbi:hypothetical protein KC19_6G029100 [Ceratodon purpureus]|uniref:Probable alanine--tRNA ligase, chloroplastic n=1 Tax=Ceratodon purpureus TaxID=3225 RepID=A0A8T0HHE2_CERPU|nr:hypothetical protein KC19_6G029100 [Ceratodon purpureus]